MKNNNQIVKNLKHLIELINQKHNNYALLLAKGAAYSKKTINYNNKTKEFSIINHIDKTKQKLSHKEIMDSNITNIGKAIHLKSLIAMINNLI